MDDTQTETPHDPTPGPADEADAPSCLQLSAKEARVLGALMEKERTTPEAYPLTQNALVTACNQKTSREPVMNLSPGEVGHTLRQLMDRELVRIEHGARAERYEQRLGNALSLNPQRQALLCLLLLRGPQTAGELLTRSARMADFADLEAVQLSLMKLIERPEPLVVQLPRAAGQREDRFAHLMSGTPSMPPPTATARPSAAARDEAIEALTARVDALEAQVAALLARLPADEGQG